MHKAKKIAAIFAAVATAATFGGCVAPEINKPNEDEDYEINGQLPEEDINNPSGEITLPEQPEQQPGEEPPKTETPTVPVVKPTVKTAAYVAVNSAGVNMRSGAGTQYSVVATAEKSTLYTYLGEKDGWYITRYRNRTVYISKKYCVVTEMNKSADEQIEAVIAEGTNVLGTPYVYGAVRLHDGKGNMLKGFSINAFDCSSLMQYMFYNGANTLLQVNTRTQVYQGKTVTKSQLKRGDLMFFTNASRKNNTGVERIGHVALYLGDNWILHTASDYAKIEQINSTRWGYFIQAQRVL